MNAYFNTHHVAGLLFMVTTMAWGTMELSQRSQLRHPSYAGLILAGLGVGLASANWAGLAGLMLVSVTCLLGRIHIEESALMTTLGDRYRAYAAQHKRLVPLVW